MTINAAPHSDADDLLATKAALPHGSFLLWIEAEFGMTARTAQKFMGVAQAYGGKSELYSHLDATALYELAAPKTPQEVHEEVERNDSRGRVRSSRPNAAYRMVQRAGEVLAAERITH